MTRKLRIVLALALGAAGTTLLGAAGIRGGDVALAQDGGTPTIVNAYSCIVVNGGHVTRPAGSEIVIRQGYATTAPGAIGAFLRAQLTTLSVDDAPMVDVSGDWRLEDSESGALAGVVHPTGVVIGAGGSMRFTFALAFDRPLTDPSDYDGDGTLDPNRGTRGLAFGGTCTVSAS